MDFSYTKNDNATLFSTLEDSELLNVTAPQNYVPLYSRLFTLNQSNYNSVNLNNPLSLTAIKNKESENKFDGTVTNQNGTEYNKPVFFKLSPLLDPVKFMTGKYDVSDANLLKLPDFEHADVGHAKSRDPNNAAYVDSFFTYLTSQMLHSHGFVHGLDFYGSFLATKQDYMVDVGDDLDYLYDSNFFHKHRGTLFELDNSFHAEMMNCYSRSEKPTLTFTDDVGTDVLDLKNVADLSQLDSIFDTDHSEKEESKVDAEPELLFEGDGKSNHDDSCSASSSCSSRSSYTDGSDNEDDMSDGGSTGSCCSTATEDAAFVKIPSFPIQIIALERCDGTLDALMANDELEDRELASMVAQLLMMLVSYQKAFGLTHNDLHTNNIMYMKTDKQYLYYKYEGKHYKVPTYGKIYKIIDFGRAIYKFRGNVFCSDSYHPKGDAATQYNFEPYFNDKKPRLEPNFSFDLCRLGCAMFDFLVEDINDIKGIKSSIVRMIAGWCFDDKGRNIMYKNNGDERYPEFKLYKMIARTVHNHVPSAVLSDTFFDRYIVGRKKINKNQKIFNVDELPSYS